VDTKIEISDGDVAALEDKLITFAHGLPAGEREHLLAMLDRASGHDEGADVQGYMFGQTWRARYALWAAAVVVPLGLAGAPSDAQACGGEVYREMDSTTQVVAKAEQLLSEGKYQQAVAKAVQAYPALKIIKPGTLHLSDRGLRIIALASVRADGAIAGGNFKATDKAANLEWSVTQLRALSTQRGNNPSYQTDLGEALSKIPAYHAEATKILEDLAQKDLLTSAEGYAALAHLRAEAGNAAGRDEALKRCEAMTKSAAICVAPEAAPAPAPVADATPGQT
jgi:predicted Zn-dependent protease